MSTTPSTRADKLVLHEAAHKLGYWSGPPNPSQPMEAESKAASRRFEALADPSETSSPMPAGRARSRRARRRLRRHRHEPALHRAGHLHGPPGGRAATPAGVYGVVSLIFWALMIVVSIKYAGFIMRAHNRGDGGIMALASLLQRHKVAYSAALVTLGIFGAALFFGDGIITPAISVLGSLQGLKVAAPGLAHLVVPISVVILIALFFLQRRGSGAIGWLSAR